MDTCITIRTLMMKNKVYVQAGAGIVADSVPEKEYWRDGQQGHGHDEGGGYGGNAITIMVSLCS